MFKVAWAYYLAFLICGTSKGVLIVARYGNAHVSQIAGVERLERQVARELIENDPTHLFKCIAKALN